MPGESISYRNNHLFINGKKIDLKDYGFDTEDFDLSELGYNKIPDDCYFVLGDNRNNSEDSRFYTIGNVKLENIVGRPWLKVYPFSDFGFVK